MCLGLANRLGPCTEESDGPGLELLQPLQAVLALHAHLGPLKMIPNDFPYPKNWRIKKIQVSSLIRNPL
jgi:hypothetical protein